MIKKCVYCGNEFEPKYSFQIFCSRDHCNRHYSFLRRNINLIKRKCSFCETDFLTKIHNKKFCSKICKSRYFRRSYPKELWKIWKIRSREKNRKINLPNLTQKRIFSRDWRKKLIKNKGYLYVFMPNHPFSTLNGYYLLHRYIYEKYLGRILSKKEIIHHIDGDKLNNNIINLERIENIDKHSLLHYASMEIDDKGRFSRRAEVI